MKKSCDNCKFEEYSWKEQVCVSCERHGMVQYKDNWQPKPTDKDQTKAEDNKVKLKRRETCMYCGQKITAGQEDAIEEVIPGIIKQVDTALVNKDKQIEQLQAEIKLEQSNAKEAEKCATRLIDKLDKAVERNDNSKFKAGDEVWYIAERRVEDTAEKARLICFRIEDFGDSYYVNKIFKTKEQAEQFLKDCKGE